jgi:hypothetical protein
LAVYNDILIKYRTAKISYTKLFLSENNLMVNILGNVAKTAEKSYKNGLFNGGGVKYCEIVGTDNTCQSSIISKDCA